MRGPRRHSSVWSTPMMTGPDGTRAVTTMRTSTRAGGRPDQALRLSTRWKAANPGCSAKPRARRQLVTVRGPTASTAPIARAAVVGRVRREKAARNGASQVTKRSGRWRSGGGHGGPERCAASTALNRPAVRWAAMLSADPVQRPSLPSQSREMSKVEARSIVSPYPETNRCRTVCFMLGLHTGRRADLATSPSPTVDSGRSLVQVRGWRGPSSPPFALAFDGWPGRILASCRSSGHGRHGNVRPWQR